MDKILLTCNALIAQVVHFSAGWNSSHWQLINDKNTRTLETLEHFLEHLKIVYRKLYQKTAINARDNHKDDLDVEKRK